MKSNTTKAMVGGAGERQARKQKRILIALAAITLLTWSRSVLGGDAEPAVNAAANAPLGTASSSIAGARSTVKSITSFEQASERMTLWPAALERRVIQGAIPDLTPAYWMTGPAHGEDEAGETEARPEVGKSSNSKAFNEDVDELPLNLRSTALLGAYRYAVIGKTRYSEGDLIQVPGIGELRLESVRSREVVLRKGKRTWTLTIRTAFDEEGI